MLHHNSIGYLFPGMADVSITNDAVVGNWTKLANRMTGNPTRDLFTATVQHGVKLENVDFVYVVFPGVSAVQFPDLAQQYLADTAIIANSAKAQVLHVRANSSIATSAKGDFLAGMIFDNSTSLTSAYFGRVATFGASTAAFVLVHHPPASNTSISKWAGPTLLADSSCTVVR